MENSCYVEIGLIHRTMVMQMPVILIEANSNSAASLMVTEPGSKQACLQDSLESPGGLGAQSTKGTPRSQGRRLVSKVSETKLMGGECLELGQDSRL